MKPRTIDKQLYKLAALLVVVGAVEWILNFSDSHLGLHLILAGHLIGITAIFIYMKYVNDLERNNQTAKEKSTKFHNR